LETPNKYH
jgi:serine/threonine protein phosphatase PrpC